MKAKLAAAFRCVVAAVFIRIVMGTSVCASACLHAVSDSVPVSLVPPLATHARRAINKPASGHAMA